MKFKDLIDDISVATYELGLFSESDAHYQLRKCCDGASSFTTNEQRALFIGEAFVYLAIIAMTYDVDIKAAANDVVQRRYKRPLNPKHQFTGVLPDQGIKIAASDSMTTADLEDCVQKVQDFKSSVEIVAEKYGIKLKVIEAELKCRPTAVDQ